MGIPSTTSTTTGLPSPTPEQRRQATLQFERGSALVASGAYQHGIRLLRECCRLEPANLLYRQALRRAEKARFGNRPPTCWFAWLFNWRLRCRFRAACRVGNPLQVLELGEALLVDDPWESAVQVQMAVAAESLGLIDLAIWLLEQARHRQPNHPEWNRQLAHLYERRGHFTQALALWQLVLEAVPQDEEARRKVPALAPLSSDPQQRTQERRSAQAS